MFSEESVYKLTSCSIYCIILLYLYIVKSFIMLYLHPRLIEYGDLFINSMEFTRFAFVYKQVN